jgi:DNA-binding SARP family transcriptional activator
MTEFRILGPLEVVGDDGPLALGGLKQRALLAILLVHANRVVPTDQLIDTLWGEDVPRTAKTSLQNFVSQLRALIGPDALQTRAPGYVLRVEREQLDLAQFEALVAEARVAPIAERAVVLRRALELWRGQPLADMTYEAFAQTEIRRLEELRVGALEDRIEADLELGAHDELVPELEALAAQHPSRERVRGLLMLALYRSGRQAEALQAYHEGRRALDDELGIEPSRELQELYRMILRQDASIDARRAAAPPAEDHVGEVVKALLSARLVPVLGCAFPPLPDEVASHLAGEFELRLDGRRGLSQISQIVAVTKGVGPLYDELHALFDRDYPPTAVHRFLASLPPLLRERGLPHQLIVTTGYDDALERAFAEAGEELDVVSYIALGRNRGKFLHQAPDGSPRVVEAPNEDTELTLERRTVVLNVHGHVDRGPDREWESFVVSEDDYIDYLADTELSSVVPVTLAAKLRRSHFLFLGYALQEWNLRVFLRRVWAQERAGYRSWAVEPDPDPLAREYWRQRDVDIFAVPVDEYVEELRRRVDALALAEA